MQIVTSLPGWLAGLVRVDVVSARLDRFSLIRFDFSHRRTGRTLMGQICTLAQRNCDTADYWWSAANRIRLMDLLVRRVWEGGADLRSMMHGLSQVP